MRWRLRELGEAKGFNAHSLAIEAKLSYGSVRPIWLNEARRADLDTLDKLSAVLQVEPGALIERVANDPTPETKHR